MEIKKERDLKEEQLKFASSATEKKGKVFCHKNGETVHHVVGIYDCSIPQYEKDNSSKELLESGVKPSKAVGIQTDAVGESDISMSKNDFLFVQHHRNTLLDIWNSCNGKKFGRDLALKLFSTCEVDLQVLFGHLNMRYPLKTKVDTSRMGTEPLMGLPESVVAAKVSHLYLILTKIGNEMVRFEDLLEALIDLCGLNNEAIVYRSLRVLHAVLKYAFSMKRNVSSRDNVVVTSSEHAVSDKFGHRFSDNESMTYAGTKILQPGNLACGENLSNARVNSFTLGPALSVSGVDWSSLFEMMQKITVKHLEEHIRLEAVSIMNIIVISCNAYSEREKFASVLFFQSMVQLLRNEAGLAVRKQVVKLLYQLLNCPKVTAILFSGYQGQEDAATESDANISSTIQEFGVIMEGLVDCIACSDNSANELKLRRSAITLVAFLASLGKMGYAIILNDRHPGRNNILACILQSLMSDVDSDALDSSPSFDVFRERTLLMREILIFLNRVVSHPQYSIPVLQALRSSRDVASLTVNIANRLSQKRKCLFQGDTITKQIREFEITELARVFKRRVFTFMGDGIP